MAGSTLSIVSKENCIETMLQIKTVSFKLRKVISHIYLLFLMSGRCNCTVMSCRDLLCDEAVYLFPFPTYVRTISIFAPNHIVSGNTHNILFYPSNCFPTHTMLSVWLSHSNWNFVDSANDLQLFSSSEWNKTTKHDRWL